MTLSRLLSALRRITGMPDYAAYVAHLRTAHPDAPVPSEREYFDQYLEARYESGATDVASDPSLRPDALPFGRLLQNSSCRYVGIGHKSAAT